MSEDLREAIASLPSMIEIPAAPPLGIVRRRGRRRQMARRILGACAAGVVAVGVWASWGLLATGEEARRMRGATGFPFTTPVAGEDAYVFSNIEVAYRDRPSRDTSFVSFDIAWGTEEWPGIYECSWTVYGKDGKVVGEVTDAVPLIRHRRSAPGLVEYVRVSGRPDHAEIGCHGSRLDSPGGDFARATPAPDTHPYPRGAFESCPDLEGTVRVTSSDAKGAWRVALRFDAAVVHHRVDTIERLADRSVSAPATHPWASTLEVNEWARITRSEPATSDDMVIFGCGRKVARRSWAVTVSDKNQFHSASMGSATFYLVRRAEGWRVWGSY